MDSASGMYNSLYIHVPFCAGGKCDYCAFASQGCSTKEERGSYLEGLKAEFHRKSAECAPLRSIFIGGGTPTSLETDELAELFAALHAEFEMQDDCEFSCEANPESLNKDKITVLKSGGVNRLSIGIQSFNPEMREKIGRRGTLGHLTEIVSFAKREGLGNINFDLIYSIPGQTVEQWRRDLGMAIALKPDHLSCYSLILEEGTPLAERIKEDDTGDELFLDCWKLNDELLGGAGFRRYEISNFAREGRRCRHNYEIWHGQTYLGCGPSAVSFDGNQRTANPSSLSKWLHGEAPEIDELPHRARMREVFAFGMRTVEGWQWNELSNVTGLECEGVCSLPELQELLDEGLVVVDEHGIRPTAKGLLFNDRILSALIL